MSVGDRATAQSLAVMMAMGNDDLQGACLLVEGMSPQDLRRAVMFLARFAAVVAVRDEKLRGRDIAPRWQALALKLSADAAWTS